MSASWASRSWPRRSTIRTIVPIYEAGAIEDLLFIAVGYDAPVRSGIHCRTADTQGAVLGKKVARYLRKHYFQPVS